MKKQEKFLVSKIEIEITSDNKYVWRQVKTSEGIVYKDRYHLQYYPNVTDLIQQIEALYCSPPKPNYTCNCGNNRRNCNRFFRKIRAKFFQFQIKFFQMMMALYTKTYLKELEDNNVTKVTTFFLEDLKFLAQTEADFFDDFTIDLRYMLYPKHIFEEDLD